MTVEKQNELINMGFFKENNYKIIEIDKDKCILEGIVTESSLNFLGIIHGGYIFGLIDTAAGMLVNNMEEKAVTTSAFVDYIKKATGKSLVATAKFIKKGRHISNIDVEVIDKSGTLIAKAIVNFMRIENI